MYEETRTRVVQAPAAAVWEVLSSLGGPAGWHGFDWLWRSRAALDRLVGGPGMRGRTARLTTSGQVSDFWVVEDIEPGSSLVLRAEMRMPGTPRLGFGVTERGRHGSVLIQRTWFEPQGLLGHLLWWSELPAHKVVFSTMLDNIVAEAESDSTRRPQ